MASSASGKTNSKRSCFPIHRAHLLLFSWDSALSQEEVQKKSQLGTTQ
jgi:hypothetical protein